MADFLVRNHGSVWNIQAQSDGAKVFAEENFAVPGWSGIPEDFTTDHRVAVQLVEQLEMDGFEIEGV